MQTSIAMIIEEVKRLSNLYENRVPSVLLFETLFKALEMEKQQIIDAWEMGRFNIDALGNGEEYYNETFKNK